MVVEAKERLILKRTIPNQRLNEDRSVILTREASLSYPNVHEQLAPYIVAEIDGMKGWMVIVNRAAYSYIGNVMVMNISDTYIPDPTRLADEVGGPLMSRMAQAARPIYEQKRAVSCYWGINNTPRSLQPGGQSILTKLHFQIWAQPNPEDDQSLGFIREEELTPAQLRAIKGTSFGTPSGRLVRHFLDNFSGDQQLLDEILDRSKTEISRRGIRVPLRKNIVEILETPGFYTDVFRPLTMKLDEVCNAISEALTNFKPASVDLKIASLVNKELAAISPLDIEDLKSPPKLLASSVRLKNIRRLRKQGFPPALIRALNYISPKLGDGKTELREWKTGGGYALVFSYDKESQSGYLTIAPAIYAGPFGVVETAEGVYLERISDYFPEEEMEELKASLYSDVASRVNDHKKLF
ncbi:hypothetical protein HYS94_01145 [Candidatus Daviesbacteria bacterium]|nr:hypothetical protein [Candidatus Daviesbacteria bacterium]